MTTIFPMKFLLSPVADWDTIITKRHAQTISTYYDNWVARTNEHPVFGKGGWRCGFFHPGRFQNRYMYAFLQSLKFNGLLDVGCYDGLLVQILCECGIDAWGFEENYHAPYYDYLPLAKGKINSPQQKQCDIVLAFSVAQNFSNPKDFLDYIVSKNHGAPKILFFDREATRGLHMQVYYDIDNIAQFGFQSFTFYDSVNKDAHTDIMVKVF